MIEMNCPSIEGCWAVLGENLKNNKRDAMSGQSFLLLLNTALKQGFDPQATEMPICLETPVFSAEYQEYETLFSSEEKLCALRMNGKSEYAGERVEPAAGSVLIVDESFSCLSVAGNVQAPLKGTVSEEEHQMAACIPAESYTDGAKTRYIQKELSLPVPLGVIGEKNWDGSDAPGAVFHEEITNPIPDKVREKPEGTPVFVSNEHESEKKYQGNVLGAVSMPEAELVEAGEKTGIKTVSDLLKYQETGHVKTVLTEVFNRDKIWLSVPGEKKQIMINEKSVDEGVPGKASQAIINTVEAEEKKTPEKAALQGTVDIPRKLDDPGVLKNKLSVLSMGKEETKIYEASTSTATDKSPGKINGEMSVVKEPAAIRKVSVEIPDVKSISMPAGEVFTIVKEPAAGESGSRYTLEQVPMKIRSFMQNQNSEKTQRPGTLELSLEPESLGKLTVTVNWNKGQISAQFFAQNQHSAAVLSRGMEVLKENLSRMNINVAGLSVIVAGESVKESGVSQLWGFKREKERAERGLGNYPGKRGSAGGGINNSSVNCLI